MVSFATHHPAAPPFLLTDAFENLTSTLQSNVVASSVQSLQVRRALGR